MKSLLLPVVVAMVRGWTRLYTRRISPRAGEARRAEIDSDLWEQQEDARASGDGASVAAGRMLTRLLLGIPDDVRAIADN